MSFARPLFGLCLITALLISASTGTQSLYEVVSDFGTSDGIYVAGPLVVEPDGTIYGTTVQGGLSNQGTIFKVDAFGVRTTLHAFSGPDGTYPMGGLTKGSDGAFYGTTNRGGDGNWGTIFRVTSTGSFTTLESFDPITAGSTLTGYFPSGGLTLGADGHLYGVTSEGGQFSGGVIFRVTAIGQVDVVHEFSSGAWSPNPWLSLGPDGALYGATRNGDVYSNGSVFRFVPGSGVTYLYHFAAASGGVSAPDGRSPSGPLAVTGDGSIYGTNQYGGPLELGTVFRLTNAGAFSVLHAFSPMDPAMGQYLEGYYPNQGVTQAIDGNLYAATPGGSNGAGVLLRIDAGTGTVSVAHTLDYWTTGSTVQTTLVLGGDGRLYGATQSGATGNYGALFAYDPVAGGVPSILYAFTSLTPISTPWSGLTKASNGRLYGTTSSGGIGHGGVFRLEANGTTTRLHSFAAVDGNQPQSELIEGPDGALYGVTPTGGDHNVGTIFRVDTNGVLTRLHSFVYENGGCPQGCQPYGTLAVGADSALYGTTAGGGQYGAGVLYRVTTTGAFSVHHHFGGAPSDGASPYGGVISGADGRIYGTTPNGGGPQQAGTVFVYDPVAGVTVLHAFESAAGSGPYAPLVQGTDGMLYGTTRGMGSGALGTVFRVDPMTGAHSTLHTFVNPADGAYPVAGLAQGSDGAFYGVTSYGGANPDGGDSGTIFRITAAGEFSLLRTFNSSDGGGHRAHGRLVEVERGVFYGTTAEGGPTGRGTVFRLTVPMPPENTPPGANDGTLSTLEDTTASGILSGGDVDGDPLVFSLVSNGTLGTAAISNPATGAFTYTPHPDAFGEDTFTFKVNDGQADSNVGAMTVTVSPVNDAPVAQDGTLAMNAGASATGTLVALDVDSPTLTYTLVANGAKGTATITNMATGAYTYTSNSGTSGSDTFTFKANDGALDSNVAMVTVAIAAGNQAPVALTGVVTTQEDMPVSGTFQASDADGDGLTFALTGEPALGAVQLLDAATGAFVYTPHPGVTGYDTFTFSVNDGQAVTAGTQMVFIVAASAQWPGQTTRASVTSAGTQANGLSEVPTISADGRFVAFESVASLVSGDTNGAGDVFIRDRQSGETTRVSVGSGGTQANGSSFAPALSADGRFVAFHSLASNLVPGDTNGNYDVFVHDRQTGETMRASVGTDATQGNGLSERPSLSADGRFVTFHSAASNLVSGDSNGMRDVFVHDRQTGETTRVSVGSGGAGNNHSDRPRLSADGRLVVFHSVASNLVPGDTNGTHDVFVHDRQTNQTTRVSVASDGTQANYASTNPTISADGRFVAFHSAAWNLVPGDIAGAFNVFVRDRVTGVTTRASAGSGGVAGNGNSFLPTLSADGRSVAFYSYATNLVAGDTNGTWDVFVVDRLSEETARVSVGTGGAQANGESYEPALSADGRVVAFYSLASNLVPGDTNGTGDVFVADGVGAAAPPIAEDGSVGTSEDVPVDGTLVASDANGAVLTFTLLSTGSLGTAVLTDATTGTFTYTPNPHLHGTDTFMFEVSNGTATSNVATVTVTIAPVNDAPVANDGAFPTSEDTPAGGTLSAADVDGPTLTFSLVSTGTLGTAVITDAASGAFTYTPNPNAHGTDSFMWWASDGQLVSEVASMEVTITAVNDAPVAHTVVRTTQPFTGVKGRLDASDVDGDALTFTLTGAAALGAVDVDFRGGFGYWPNPDATGYDSFTFEVSDGESTTTGLQMVFIVAPTLDLPGQTTRTSVASDGTQGDGGSASRAISADGRIVAFVSRASTLVAGDTNGHSDIFVRDRQTGATTRVSLASDNTEANSDSDWPALSADGRYVAFYSRATNLVADDTNGREDVFLHDRQTGTTRRVSVASDGVQGNADSLDPAVSADGRYVAFQSAATNLSNGDVHGFNVFVHDLVSGETTRVSTPSVGQPNRHSVRPALSADGRYVAFESDVSTLVTGDTNDAPDVFVYDRNTGETTRVSVATDGSEGNRDSRSAAISADGRVVAFHSSADNLVAGDTNGDVVIHDRVTSETTLVSTASDGARGNRHSDYPSISADGRYVAFLSMASNLVPGDNNGYGDIFVKDLTTGQTLRVSVASDGTEGDFPSDWPAISADGGFVVFDSNARNLVVGDTNGTWDVFVVGAAPAPTAPTSEDSTLTTPEDTQASGTLSGTDPQGRPLTFSLVADGTLGTAVITDGATGAYTYTPHLNAYGTDTFTFRASNDTATSNVATVTVTITPVNDAPVASDGALSTSEDTPAGGTLSATDVDGPAPTFRLVSNGTLGTATISDPATGEYIYTPNLNAFGTDTFTFRATDGSLLSDVATITVTIDQVNDAPVARTGVLTTQTSSPVEGQLSGADSDGDPMTFALAMAPSLGVVELLDGNTGTFRYTPNAGAHGYDSFTFSASDGEATTMGTQMVFIVAATPQWPGGTTRVSMATDDTQGDGGSTQPALGADGRYMAFSSDATNLVADDTNGTADVFVRDRQTGTTTRVSVASDGTQGDGPSLEPSMSADGRYVTFVSSARNFDDSPFPGVFVHDRQFATTTRVSVSSEGTPGSGSFNEPVISADGRYVAFWSTSNDLVPVDNNGAPAQLERTDTYVHDRETGITTRVSVATDGALGNGPSFQPAISADGRYVAFWSYSNNLVPGDTNALSDTFVHDRQTGETARVSVASGGTQGVAGIKEGGFLKQGGRYVALSADGRYVAFFSHASNLVAGDTNGEPDVFLHDRQTGVTTLESLATDGTQTNDRSLNPAISADGRYVAFSTWATTLAADDAWDGDDVFVRDRQTGQTRRVSPASDGLQSSAFPALSADGRFAAFRSNVATFVASDTNFASDVFVVGGVSVSPMALSSPANGVDDAVAVTFVYPGTTWTATGNVPWITIANQSSANGNGTVSYSVAPNTGPERVGTLTVALQTVTITQQGAPVPVDQDPLFVTGAPASAVYGDSFTVSTSGGSGTGALTFAATGACTNSNGDAVITMTSGTGTCTIVATKAGDAQYNEATSAPASVLATKAAQDTLTVTGAPATAAFGTSFAVATAGGSGNGAVSFSVSGACTNTDGAALITMTASSGTCSITALKAADDNYAQATSAAAAVAATAPVPPAAPSALSASALSANQVALSWTDNASSEDGFKIERSTTNTNNFVQVATVEPNVTSFTDADLKPATKYHYRVRAYVSATSLDSSYSNTATATTLSAPNAPTGLIATASSPTQINLAWADKSNNELGFRIERSTDGTTFTPVAAVAANATTFSDSGLTASTLYHYRVSATNANGDSAYSNTASAATHGTAATIPSAPTTLTASSANGLKITLRWTDTAANELGFTVERSLDATSFTEIATVGADIGTYVDSGLSPMTTYHYRVTAFNNAGVSPPSNTASAKTKAK